MKPTNIIILTTIIAVLGAWGKTGKLGKNQIVGGIVVYILFFALEGSQPELADRFSWLLFAGVMGGYGQEVFGIVGNITQGKQGAPAVPSKTGGAPNSGVGGHGDAVT